MPQDQSVKMRGGSYIWTLRVSWLLRYARKPDAIAVASRANSCVTKRQIKHVCNDAQACGRVVDVGSQIKNPIAVMYVV